MMGHGGGPWGKRAGGAAARTTCTAHTYIGGGGTHMQAARSHDHMLSQHGCVASSCVMILAVAATSQPWPSTHGWLCL